MPRHRACSTSCPLVCRDAAVETCYRSGLSGVQAFRKILQPRGMGRSQGSEKDRSTDTPAGSDRLADGRPSQPVPHGSQCNSTKATTPRKGLRSRPLRGAVGSDPYGIRTRVFRMRTAGRLEQDVSRQQLASAITARCDRSVSNPPPPPLGSPGRGWGCTQVAKQSRSSRRCDGAPLLCLASGHLLDTAN